MTKYDIVSYIPEGPFKNFARTLSDYFYKDNVRTVLASLGIAVTLYHSAKCLGNFSNAFLYTSSNLGKRYGQGSWVVVTGASEGLGRAFSLELASQGFNIILIDKCPEKLESVQREIALLGKTTGTLIIPADFSNCFKEKFFDDIFIKIRELDISMLINSADVSQNQKFNLLDPKIAFNQVAINCHVQTMMTKILIEHFLHRAKRTAIINVSSIGSDFLSPRDALYVATKKYVDIQTQVFQDEFGEKIDILNLKPGHILKSSCYPQKKLDMKTVSATEYAQSSLKRLGKVKESHGHWKHEVTNMIWKTVPNSWVKDKNLCLNDQELLRYQASK